MQAADLYGGEEVSTTVGRCTLCILLTHLLLVWLAVIYVGQWEGWIMYVSANEKTVSLNVHRYATANNCKLKVAELSATVGLYNLNSVDP
jgi:hypothetical protein